MKFRLFLAAGQLTLAAATAWSQQSPPPPGARLPPSVLAPSGAASSSAELSKFNLDFPGGSARELVAAIQKALGKPLNAIVPEEYTDTKLPALKMKNIDVSQLFQALQAATRKTVMYTTGSYYGGAAFGGYKSTQQYQTSCGFRSVSDRLTDDTIWYFYVDRPSMPEGSSPTRSKVCRFYALAPYLERRLTVDDITTAIETGWKMLGEPTPATINFHKDTKLLIAVGEPSALETIDAVLKALEEPKPAPAPIKTTAKPAEKSSTTEEQ